MKESLLDVLIYLFENYMFDDDGYEPDQETLALELSQAGFEHAMIDQAFDWLENLARLCEQEPGREFDRSCRRRPPLHARRNASISTWKPGGSCSAWSNAAC